MNIKATTAAEQTALEATWEVQGLIDLITSHVQAAIDQPEEPMHLYMIRTLGRRAHQLNSAVMGVLANDEIYIANELQFDVRGTQAARPSAGAH